MRAAQGQYECNTTLHYTTGVFDMAITPEQVYTAADGREGRSSHVHFRLKQNANNCLKRNTPQDQSASYF